MEPLNESGGQSNKLPNGEPSAFSVQQEPGPVNDRPNRPPDTDFKQQRIPSWNPVMAPRCAVTCFFTVGILFLIIGAVVIVASDDVSVIEFRYDQMQECGYNSRLVPDPQAPRTNTTSDGAHQHWACPGVDLEFVVTKTMKAPVHMYYRIANLYQNHRKYARSLNALQLAGESDPGDLSDCDPLLKLGGYKTLKAVPNGTGSVVGLLFPSSTGNQTVLFDASRAVYNPCGLIAWSKFNDTFILRRVLSNTTVVICETGNYQVDGSVVGPSGNCSKTGITWSSDVGGKYGAAVSVPGSVLTSGGWLVDPNYVEPNYTSSWGYYVERGWYIGEPGHQVPNPLDEDLMVWNRLALLDNFQKFHRIIDVDLFPGVYRWTVFQRFDIRAFSGKKTLVLTTSNWLGGSNYWLAGMYIGVGSVCVVLGVAFLVKTLTSPSFVTL